MIAIVRPKKRPWIQSFIAAVCFAIILTVVLFKKKAERPAQMDFDRIPVPNGSFEEGILHVDVYGSGQHTLVFIPGLGSGSWVWYNTITEFVTNYTIYTITLPGFDGRLFSDKTPLVSSFLNDFWIMVAAHNVEKPVVIGHSMGGMLAIALAEGHPERLAGIVAVDGLPVYPPFANATLQERETRASQMAKASSSCETIGQRLAYQSDFLREKGTDKPELVEPLARLQARSDPKAIAAWISECLPLDLRPGLARITIPFLEIVPYNPIDAQSPRANTEAQILAVYQSLLAGAPHASAVAVAPSRHFVMFDQPEIFHQKLKQFLSAITWK